MIEEVYRQDDEVRRDFEQWQWKREREQLKKAIGWFWSGLQNTHPGERPMQSTATMDPE